jgi:outer membrane protein assembly factor BamA
LRFTYFVNKLFLSFAFIFIALYASAQIELKKDSLTKKGKRRNFFGFPAVIYSPETTFSFGGAGTLYFKIGHEPEVRTSSIQALALYSLRGQAVLGAESTIYFHNEKYVLKSHVSVSHFPDRFWGIGNDAKEEDLEKYTITQFYIYPQLLRKIYKKLFAGISYEIQNVFSVEYGVDKQPGASLFDVQQVDGRKGSLVSGLGLVVLYDTRNSAFSPDKGFYFSYTFNDFHPRVGSDFSYTNHFIDARKYFSMGKNKVLAFQLINNFNEGDVPIRSLTSIGSSSMLRGYYDGRYVDKNLFGIQTEYRFPIKGRFGMVAFAALGRVGATVSEIYSFQNMKPSFGTGLRYAIDKKEKLNLRLDFGIGRKSDGIYFNLTEAF